MDIVQSISAVAWAIPVIIIVVVLIVVLLYVRSRWKVAKADQALVITGGKKGMRIRVAGGGFVSPFEKHQFFPLGTMTVESPDQETQTSTLIQVVVKWTAQLRPATDTPGPSGEADTNHVVLRKAIIGFIDRDIDDIKKSLQQTLDGEIRSVVATLTPEEVVKDKEGFSSKVTGNVDERMKDLGFELISLNISEVSDRKGYYENLSAPDREQRRRTAATLTAQADRDIAVNKAQSDRAAKEAELEAQLTIAEKERGVTVRTAEIKAETDRSKTDAEYAGQIQAQDREAELETRRGQVNVVRQQQLQAEAVARREVTVADAETAKRQNQIEAESAAQQRNIEAEAQATVAKSEAKGKAEAAIESARGEAEATNARAKAEADQTRLTGLAKADVTRAQGEADATAILERGKADAEVQRLMAEALSAHEGANLQVALAEIQRDTTVKIYTTMGEAMAHVGEKATFIDMGGSTPGGGDLLSNTLGNVPKMFKELDVQSQALNGSTLGTLIGGFLNDLRKGKVQEGGQSASSEMVKAEATPTTPTAPKTDSTDGPDIPAPDEGSTPDAS